MLKNAVLFVLLLSSYAYGQFILWEPYIDKLWNIRDVIKLDYSQDSTKLYVLTSYALFSYDFTKDSVETLLDDDFIMTHMFVNNNNVYVLTRFNSEYKIYASYDGGKTWSNIIIEHMTSLYVNDNIMYFGRWYQTYSDWYLPPPTYYGIWTADSMGNNQKLYHPANVSKITRIIGNYKNDLYFYADVNVGKDGVFKCNDDSIQLLTTNSTFYLNQNNGDVFYRKDFDNDSLFKVNSKEVYKIPSIQWIYFFDSTNILVACDTSFYLKYSVPYFRKFSDNNGKVNYMMEDKDNYLLLATEWGIYRSTFKLRWLNTYSNKDNIEDEIDFKLLNNYPNPFNPSTKIYFTVDQSKHIKLKVFDLLGKEVKVLVDEFKSAGSYDIDFNGADLPSGVYIYSLTDGKNIISKKMSLIK